MSSGKDNATCTNTSAALRLTVRLSEPSKGACSCIAAATEERETCTAGARPKRSPVMTEANNENPSTQTSIGASKFTRTAEGTKCINPLLSQVANNIPTAAP